MPAIFTGDFPARVAALVTTAKADPEAVFAGMNLSSIGWSRLGIDQQYGSLLRLLTQGTALLRNPTEGERTTIRQAMSALRAYANQTMYAPMGKPPARYDHTWYMGPSGPYVGPAGQAASPYTTASSYTNGPTLLLASLALAGGVATSYLLGRGKR